MKLSRSESPCRSRRRLARLAGAAIALRVRRRPHRRLRRRRRRDAGDTQRRRTTRPRRRRSGRSTSTPFPRSPSPTKPYKVVLLQAHRSDAFAISAAQAVQEMGKENGVEVIVNDAGGYQNVPKQIDQIEAAILEKPDALILWSTDPTAVVPAVEKAEGGRHQGRRLRAAPDAPTEFTVTGDFTLDGETMATQPASRRWAGRARRWSSSAARAPRTRPPSRRAGTRASDGLPGHRGRRPTRPSPTSTPRRSSRRSRTSSCATRTSRGVMTTTTAMAASAYRRPGGRRPRRRGLRRRPDPRRLRSDPPPAGGPPGDRARRPGRLLRALAMANTIKMLEGEHGRTS